ARGHITTPPWIESPDHAAFHHPQRERRRADCRGGAAGATRLRAARPAGSHRDAHRLRYEPVRRLHGAYRRPRREELYRARDAGRGACDHDHRGPERERRGRPAPATAGVLGEARAAVRILHSRHDHDGGRSARREAQADRGGDPSRARGQSVPLHRLSKHRRRDPGRGRRAVRREPDMATLFGSGIKRREDPRLITGKATYTDDVKLPGLLYAAVLRSTYAHAKLEKVDVAKAKKAPGNVAFTWKVAGGDAAKAFADAPVTVEQRILQNRLLPTAMEPRAACASYNPGTGQLTIWITSQNPHIHRFLLSVMTKLPEH